MARRDTQFIKGEYYHVYNRGRNRENIFKEGENYSYLLRILSVSIRGHKVSVIAYCLMPNHYHFLLRQDSESSISVLMHEVFNRYSKAFNKRYRRTGTLFEERFKAKVVDEEGYLIHLCRYIHRNPMDAGLVKTIEDWPFSNYLDWIGNRGDGLVDREFVNAHFSTPEDYTRFVLDYESPKATEKGLGKYLFD